MSVWCGVSPAAADFPLTAALSGRGSPGVRDRVVCGPGRDSVDYLATGIDPLDAYRRCERVLSGAPLTRDAGGNDRARCLGRDTTLVCTSAETIVGTAGPDVIAGGGDDTRRTRHEWCRRHPASRVRLLACCPTEPNPGATGSHSAVIANQPVVRRSRMRGCVASPCIVRRRAPWGRRSMASTRVDKSSHPCRPGRCRSPLS